MSRHFSLKDFTATREPITFEANGKEYTVLDMTDDHLREIDSVNSLNLNQGEILNAQLAIFTGCDASEFAGLHFEQKRAIANHIITNFDTAGK